MALPALNTDDSNAPLPLSLARRYLEGKWALLFSHAEDFACHGFEADRWLWLVRDAFTQARIHPLALHGQKFSCPTNWVTEVGGLCVTAEPGRRSNGSSDGVFAVHEAMVQIASRFVMILDSSLRLRRTICYTPQGRLPSPIDLIAMAENVARADQRLQTSRNQLKVARQLALLEF